MSIPRHAEGVLSSTSIGEVFPSDDPQLVDEESNEFLRGFPRQCATDLLLLLSPNDRMFDSVSPINSSEQSSQISIPFSDVVVDDGARKAVPSDRDGEAMTFSSEFKKALAESRNPEKESVGASPVAKVMEENPEHVLQTEQLSVARNSHERPNPSPLLSEKLNSIARSLDEFRVRTPSEERSDSFEEQGDNEDDNEGKVKKMTAKIKQRQVPAITKPVDTDVEFYDTSSGLWRMLSAYDDLVLSQPGYNTFRQEEQHWLESDTVPWRILEESRKKCLDWLDKYYKQKLSA